MAASVSHTDGGSRTAPAPCRFRVTHLEATARGSRLSGPTASGTRRATVPARPDVERARRWLSAVRRVDRLVIDTSRPRPDCLAQGTGHRLPFVRPVAPEIGLGLMLLGVPVIVHAAEGHYGQEPGA